MFCHKCGTKLLDDSEFCYKCGAKLNTNDADQQADTSVHVRQMQSQVSNIPAEIPEKRKLKRLPIILGAAAFVFLVIIIAAISGDILERGEQAKRDEEYIAAKKQSLDVAETSDAEEKEIDKTYGFTEEDALNIAQQFIDEHPLYIRTITGTADFEPTDTQYNYDVTGLYRIGLVTEEGLDRTMWVSRETGEVFISADGNTLLTGEQFYETAIIDQALNETGFQRTEYFTGITRMDLLRYPDNYYNNKVYFTEYEVSEVIEPKVYLVKDANILANSNNYLIIDDLSNNGANAVVGDRVAVYGTFNQNNTVTFQDGRSEQIPIIMADRFIVNNILPDMEDLAQALVECMNQRPYVFGNDSKYISGSRVQLVMGVYGMGKSTDIAIYDSSKMNIPYQDTTYIGDVDGYTITINPQLSPGIVSPKDAGVQLSEDELGLSPVRVNATITSIEQNVFAPYLLELTFNIESFEPY